HTTLVFVKEKDSITVGIPNYVPNSYFASPTFRIGGSQYQNDTGAFCMYKGDTNFVIVNNLIQGKIYNVLVWVLRDSDNLYATQPTLGSGTSLPLPLPKKLIHYWHFNNHSTGLLTPVIANSFGYYGIPADYSTLDTTKAAIFYRTLTGTSDNYQTYWDTTAGTYNNVRLGNPPGASLRVRNPSDSMQLLFYIPTTHYQNIVIKFACQKSSIQYAQYQQNYDYSINGGNTWRTSGLSMLLDSNFTENFSTVTITLMANDTFAYNNPSFVFRIRFSADPGDSIGLPSSTAGNNRFDNFTVEGDTTTVTPYIGVNEIEKTVSSFTLFPNPANNQLTIRTENSTTKNIFIMNITGQVVTQKSSNDTEIKIDLSNLPAGLYFVRVAQGDSQSMKKLMKE
ncbi:MAG: T9SS type A sorting domain-containing protein, partial [Bacteroidia bacterium]